jgi:hypothetical protein
VSLAVPLNEGVVWFERDGGAASVTFGEAVLTVNVRASLLPSGLPSELFCVAWAVYVPLDSAGLAAPELQEPPVPEAFALDTTVPLALEPA